MAKELDWNHVFTGGFEERRRARGFRPMNEQIQKARVREAAQAEHNTKLEAQEPLLKSILLKFCVEKTPIKVLQSFGNPTEALGGVTKSMQAEEDELDNFYYKGASENQTPTINASYEEVMETIPAGTELIFKSYDKQLDKMVFKTQTGQEVEIYTKPLVFFQQRQIKNPGYYGLLHNTNISEAK